MEQTLVIIKPVAVHRGLIGEVITRFERKGLFIIGMKCIEGKDAVEVVRLMTGATNGRKALPGTIRGDLSMSGQENVVHASDSIDNAKIELARFFKPGEILAYKPSDFQFYYAPDEV